MDDVIRSEGVRHGDQLLVDGQVAWVVGLTRGAPYGTGGRGVIVKVDLRDGACLTLDPKERLGIGRARLGRLRVHGAHAGVQLTRGSRTVLVDLSVDGTPMQVHPLELDVSVVRELHVADTGEPVAVLSHRAKSAADRVWIPGKGLLSLDSVQGFEPTRIGGEGYGPRSPILLEPVVSRSGWTVLLARRVALAPRDGNGHREFLGYRVTHLVVLGASQGRFLPMRDVVVESPDPTVVAIAVGTELHVLHPTEQGVATVRLVDQDLRDGTFYPGYHAVSPVPGGDEVVLWTLAEDDGETVLRVERARIGPE